MISKTIAAAAAFALMLGACGPTPPAPGAKDAVPPRAEDDAGPPAVAPPANAIVPTANDSAAAPDLAPPVLTPEAERGVQGARNILLSFARAIELRQFEAARALLSPADRQKWNSAAFAAIFADIDRPTVAIPDGEMEGAAGSA